MKGSEHLGFSSLRSSSSEDCAIVGGEAKNLSGKSLGCGTCGSKNRKLIWGQKVKASYIYTKHSFHTHS